MHVSESQLHGRCPHAMAAATHTRMQLGAKHAPRNARLLSLRDRARKFSLCHREDVDFQFVASVRM